MALRENTVALFPAPKIFYKLAIIIASNGCFSLGKEKVRMGRRAFAA